MIQKIEVGGKEGWNLELYIPDNLPAGAKLPLILFNTGNGEVGNTESDRAEIYRNGPMKFIKEGWKPNFLVGGCQSTYGWAGYPFFLAMLQELTREGAYPLDKGAIFLTGLSGGAYACFEYVNDTPPLKYIPVRGIIPMGITPQVPTYPERYKEVSVWGFAGNNDSHHDKMKAFIQKYASDYKWTTYIGGHGGWNTFYNPNYRENGMNIYEWALSKVKFNPPVPEPAEWPKEVTHEGVVYVLNEDNTWRTK
jgi:hypothetical protein